MLEIIAKKVGMTHKFDEEGNIIPLTIVKIYESIVFDIQNVADSEQKNLTIAFKKLDNNKKICKPVLGQFNKKSIAPFKYIKTSRLTRLPDLKIGDEIDIFSILEEGDLVDISGTTIGKGFAGVMKRWNFRGLEASHGVSISHRSHGSTGQRQDPGKVFKGKKMAGHMGCDKITIKNLEVVLLNKDSKFLAVKGCIPGSNGSKIIVKTNKI